MVETEKLEVRYPELAQRLAYAMDAAGVTPPDILRYFKQSGESITPEMVRRYVHGYAMPRAAKMQILAAAVRSDAAWLQYGAGQAGHVREDVAEYVVGPVEDDSDEGTLTIHQFNTGGRMGRAGLELRDQPGIIHSWRVSPEWLHKNIRNYTAADNLCLVTGFGDSMRPMFNPGDPLVLDAGVKSVEYDAIYFFRVGNEGYIKRLQRIPTESGTVVRAKSENKAYDPFDITPKMDFEVFGQILKVWRSEEF